MTNNMDTPPFIVYGAGKRLEELLSGNSELKKHIKLIVDSNKEKIGKSIFGMEIKDNSSIKHILKDEIIAISSEKYFDEIKDDIKKINPHVVCTPLTEAVNNYVNDIGKCNVCMSPVKWWLPLGEDNSTQYKIIGSGIRYGGCPICGSMDRARWVKYVMKNYTSIYEEIASSYSRKILHFAPERELEEYLRELYKENYITGDIEEGRADCIVDITDICFEDNSFEYVIANHILEHIPDEAKAMQELKRVLKDSGTLIISFPRTEERDTLEAEYETEELRKTQFGQADHVRLYGKDYMTRIESYGFKIQEYLPIERLSAFAIKEWALIERDSVLLCTKR